ncbi:TetR/AcrR family transcriptional regulator [Marinihelvus fidelis]|uniref:TetR/AcrR family transcriptional regulator n=1 Tax=Marinihelvus fidelis TaxID=2613842 RepID=A0A5N0TE81_9GAMM|nr:TetR/AcrR family transcriptional regulator [Marinihelvus fidelis]KAA9132764.1 TetR/AcrR family transcriptional regulator [Marinihelvus fidelis]
MAAKNKRKTRKDRIIEVAEKLFAQRGFNGVSLREITREAGVDVALVKYYFDNKEGLFDALLQRRADILNRERAEALERVLERNNPAPVEDIIDAFTHPLLNEVVGEDSTWRDYFGLLAQVNNNPEWGGQAMSKYFDPLVRRFIYALKDALPDADMVDIYWCYHFLSGALTLTFADTRRIDALSGGLCHSADFESVHKRMVPFIAAGFRAICAERAEARASGDITETGS